MEKARQLCPDTTIHSFLATGTNGHGRLHISLNHPFPLRRSQIDAFRAELSQRVSTSKATRGSGSGGFTVSLAGGVKVYQNGRRYGGEGAGGRAFMALRVGAGAKEVSGDLVEVWRSIEAHLVAFRLAIWWIKSYTQSWSLSTGRCITKTQNGTPLSHGGSSISRPALRDPAMRPSRYRTHRWQTTS